MDVYTDASNNHWGLVMDETTISRPWTEEEQDHHINWKELRVIWHLVHLPEAQGRSIKIACDNTTTIAHINRFGGTRSPTLMNLTSNVWTHCLRTNTRLKTTYVPSAFNPADAPSRKMITQLEWLISPTFFNQLKENWGAHNIDLFASPENAKVSWSVSWEAIHIPYSVACTAMQT